MRTVKVFALPSHQLKDRTSGVDFARVNQPMEHLNNYVYKDIEFKVDVFDLNNVVQPNWIEVAQKYDIVFLNYTVLDMAFAAMGAPLRAMKKKMVYDLDDAVWYIRKDNPTYDQFHHDNGWYIHCVTSMINEADMITTTSRYLRNVICDKSLKRIEQIRVIPNYIDLSLYRHKFEAVEREPVTIMHYGSTTHFIDQLQEPFLNGLTRIMQRYPGVRYKTIGSFIQELQYKLSERYFHDYGDTDIYAWINHKFPQYMEEADIMVAPLEIDTYNRSKSYIKFLESSSAKRPGVYQDIVQYREIIENGKNGFLAGTEDEWYQALEKLVVDVKLRKKIGNEAYETVKKHQIKDHLDEYAKVFSDVLDL